MQGEEFAEEVEEIPDLLASSHQLLVLFFRESRTQLSLGLWVVQDGLDQVRGIRVLQHGEQELLELSEEEVDLLATHRHELFLVVAASFFGLQVFVLLIGGEVLLVVEVGLFLLDVVHFRLLFLLLFRRFLLLVSVSVLGLRAGF